MSDPFSKKKRSDVMTLIRGKGNKTTEEALIRLLKKSDIIGWRRHRPLFGKPDFVFPKSRVAIFVDGCFWHCCPIHAVQPKSNVAFWKKKLHGNRARDRLVTRTLRSKGWRVIRVWEHELTKKNESRLLKRLRSSLG